MDRLYSDFFLYDFLHVDWKLHKETPPPSMVFISVFAFAAKTSMSITKDAISQIKCAKDSPAKAIKMYAKDLFTRFSEFLKAITSNGSTDRVIRSALLHIRGNLSFLNFGSDMERLLFLPELGKNQKSNGKMMYHLYMDKIKEFLQGSLQKQFDIQYKQLDIQGRSADMEYMDFTDQEPTTDEEKDSEEIQRRLLKKAKKTHASAVLRQRNGSNKKGESYARNEAFLNWENEDIEDRIKGVNDYEREGLVKHLQKYHQYARLHKQ
jgi:hypothetical protein